MHISSRVSSIVIAISLSIPQGAFMQEFDAPYEQDFILTAYYSPLPDQCCYVKGSYEEDVILNGQGTHGADGTPVYEGMLAAPPSYAFGTRIVLPGLGAMTVHDRGGAIQEWDNAHRLDVWAGVGEEGLARALTFGVQHIRGTVYPPKSSAAPAESFTLDTLPAPEERLKPYMLPGTEMTALHPVAGKRGYSVTLLQENLAALGYFDHEVTGVYGEVTTQSVAAFNADMHLEESSDSLSPVTAAYIQAALSVQNAPSPVVFVGKESTPTDIKAVQRLLRFLGYYKGRTDGYYSEKLFTAILTYQQAQQLVGDAVSPGAGRIGPLTKSKLDREVFRRRVARTAAQILAIEQAGEKLEEEGKLITVTMANGSNGKEVRMLQELLAATGFFPSEKINGHYGDVTAAAVAKYQVARKILGTDKEKGSGVVGPVTLRSIRIDQAKKALKIVRAEGWEAL